MVLALNGAAVAVILAGLVVAMGAANRAAGVRIRSSLAAAATTRGATRVAMSMVILVAAAMRVAARSTVLVTEAATLVVAGTVLSVEVVAGPGSLASSGVS